MNMALDPLVWVRELHTILFFVFVIILKKCSLCVISLCSDYFIIMMIMVVFQASLCVSMTYSLEKL